MRRITLSTAMRFVTSLGYTAVDSDWIKWEGLTWIAARTPDGVLVRYRLKP